MPDSLPVSQEQPPERGFEWLRPWGQRLFLLLWLLELASIFLRAVPGSEAVVRPLSAIGLSLLVLLSLPLVRRPTLIVMAVGGLLGCLVFLVGPADLGTFEEGMAHAMIFAGFLPTLRLLRGTAQRQPRVRLSQQRFARLPLGGRAAGITIGSHTFGAALNTGSFPVMAAVMPPDADEGERRRFALAALRGMNLAPLWSPFFVAMALASSYLPGVELWQTMLIGLIIALASLTVSVLWFSGSKHGRAGLTAVRPGLRALLPVARPMLALAALIVAVASFAPLSTLEAIMLTVPPLCWLSIRHRPGLFRTIVHETTSSLGHSIDDLMIVTVALVLAAGAAHIEVTGSVLRDLALILPAPIAITLFIAGCFAPSLIGIHPMIPTALMLAALTGGAQPLVDPVLMGIALTAWSVGTMCSVSSLSLVICSSLFRVSPFRLMWSPNQLFALCIMLISITVLSAVQILLGPAP